LSYGRALIGELGKYHIPSVTVQSRCGPS